MHGANSGPEQRLGQGLRWPAADTAGNPPPEDHHALRQVAWDGPACLADRRLGHPPIVDRQAIAGTQAQSPAGSASGPRRPCRFAAARARPPSRPPNGRSSEGRALAGAGRVSPQPPGRNSGLVRPAAQGLVDQPAAGLPRRLVDKAFFFAPAEGFVDEATWEACRRLIDATFGADGGDKPDGLVKRLGGRGRRPPPVAHVAVAADLGGADGSRGRPAPQPSPRGPLAEPAGLRPAARLRAGGRRLARGRDVARAARQAGPPDAGVPRRMVDPLAADRRRAGGRAAAGPGRSAPGPVRALHRQTTTGKGRGGDFSFAAARDGRDLAAAGLARTAAASRRGSSWATCSWTCCRKRKMEPVRPAIVWAMGRVGARVPLYGPLNTVVPAEIAAEWLAQLMDVVRRRADGAAGRDADGPADRRPLPRPCPNGCAATCLKWLARASSAAALPRPGRDRAAASTPRSKGLVFGESLPKGLRLEQAAG